MTLWVCLIYTDELSWSILKQNNGEHKNFDAVLEIFRGINVNKCSVFRKFDSNSFSYRAASRLQKTKTHREILNKRFRACFLKAEKRTRVYYFRGIANGINKVRYELINKIISFVKKCLSWRWCVKCWQGQGMLQHEYITAKSKFLLHFLLFWKKEKLKAIKWNLWDSR